MENQSSERLTKTRYVTLQPYSTELKLQVMLTLQVAGKMDWIK